MVDERTKWLEERKTCIGGSDASSIVGMNPWKSNQVLWEEKTGRVIPEDIGHKAVVKYGVDAETPLRQLFALDFPQYYIKYNEFEIHRHEKYNFIGSTLDGELIDTVTNEQGVLEIKTTNIMNSTQREKWKDRIPDNYYIQVIHQLLTTGWDFVILKVQMKTDWDSEVRLETKHYTIKRTEVLEDIKFLEEKEVEFWNNNILKDVKPSLILPNI